MHKKQNAFYDFDLEILFCVSPLEGLDTIFSRSCKECKCIAKTKGLRIWYDLAKILKDLI